MPDVIIMASLVTSLFLMKRRNGATLYSPLPLTVTYIAIWCHVYATTACSACDNSHSESISDIPVLKLVSGEAGLIPLKLKAKTVKLCSVSASRSLKVVVTICPGEKGPGTDRTRPGGLVKFMAMDSIGGTPSGDSCTSTVREEEVEERRERMGAPVEMQQTMAIMTITEAAGVH